MTSYQQNFKTDEMDEFCKEYNLPILAQDEMQNLNSLNIEKKLFNFNSKTFMQRKVEV